MPAVPGLWAPVPQTLNFTSRSVPHKELPQNRRTACGVIFSLCLLVLPAESTKRPTLLTERLHRSALAATVGQEPQDSTMLQWAQRQATTCRTTAALLDDEAVLM